MRVPEEPIIISFTKGKTSVDDEQVIYRTVFESQAKEVKYNEQEHKDYVYDSKDPPIDTNFILENSSVIEKLPLKYKEKVLKGDSFTIEVTTKEIFNYYRKTPQYIKELKQIIDDYNKPNRG